MSSEACPRCRQPLSLAEPGSPSLWCEPCGGRFVAAGDPRAELIVPVALGEVSDPSPSPLFSCPSCDGEMVAIPLREKPVGRCKQCGGLWLDGDHELNVATEVAESSAGGLFLYTLSLPERLLRSTVGMAGGVAKELSDRLVPRAFQSSNTYTILVRNSLKFLVQDIGGVAGKEGEDDGAVENYVARKAVGNFVELAGMATLHVSPMLILAVVSDVAYGSKAYLAELGDELRQEGIIDEDSTIGSLDDLFDAVSHASGTTARLFDTPPLSVEDLRSTTGAIQEAITSVDPTKVIPQAEIRRMWDEMHAVARRDDVNLFQVSSAMTLHALGRVAGAGRGTLTGVRLAAGMVNRHIVGHYAEALVDLQTKGFYATLNEVSTPYIEAVWNNFSSERGTVTEDVLTGRLPARMLRRVAGWFRRKPSSDNEAAERNLS